jgi:predicted tellurium resistance membrane protein TerC
MDFLSNPELISQASALGKVLMIDLVLAGDNAVAVGLAAAALAGAGWLLAGARS